MCHNVLIFPISGPTDRPLSPDLLQSRLIPWAVTGGWDPLRDPPKGFRRDSRCTHFSYELPAFQPPPPLPFYSLDEQTQLSKNCKILGFRERSKQRALDQSVPAAEGNAQRGPRWGICPSSPACPPQGHRTVFLSVPGWTETRKHCSRKHHNSQREKSKLPAGPLQECVHQCFLTTGEGPQVPGW